MLSLNLCMLKWKTGNGHIRKIETNPLTNYNIIVLDQNLKNNSSVSFINTNVLRNGSDYDANVSAGLFNLNNKKNTYNFNGKFAVSRLSNPLGKGSTGYSQNLNFGKTGGVWNFQLVQDIADDKYNINDMGILYVNNYISHYLWTGYRWIHPKDWYKNIRLNFNAGYNTLFKYFANQKVRTKFNSFNTNINANAQLKNLWSVGAFMGFVSAGNDFYEPRITGYSFRSPQRIQFAGWFETNEAKKYAVAFNYFVGLRNFKLFNSPNHQFQVSHRYRFSDKFSVTQTLNYNPATNDAGYYSTYRENNVLKDIVFSRRDLTTIENIVDAKYNFNNRSGITFRARHYWSKVKQKQLYDLKTDGSLSPTIHAIIPEDKNFNIFNIDAVYTWQFAPGSFINIVWKDQDFLFNADAQSGYFKNFDRTIAEPQNNNLSVKIIYYLDYLNFKKPGKKK